MKLENNWRNKTIENLEKNKWAAIDFDSHLVKRTQELRKIPISEFTIEDLRIMIGQQIGLEYLIPIALEILIEDLWAEADFYEGDVLNSVLKIDTEFWDNNKSYWLTLHHLIENRTDELEKRKLDVSIFYKCKRHL